MDILDELNRLVALSGDVPADSDPAVAEFAEQFAVDVSGITETQRVRLREALGEKTFGVVVQMFVADFAPRVRAGLEALGVALPSPVDGPEPSGDVADALFNQFMPAVARLRSLDPVTSEVVRLRGAAQHNCRLCRSLRETTALGAGGSESLYDDIERFEDSVLLTEAQKAALRYVDALIWTPGQLDADVVAGVRAHFSQEQAVELTLDVMRNAGNKVAVALAADAPRVAEGTERYLLDDDGQTVFG
ncbi:carboxymuconolactone decarboxylase family protein [Mycolicibacter arupensis]|jgi:alkylhydroperoxidase family enzyme|uniref:Carboxymuconolactone decarboxylase family protein n=1 Tax=Mycolicibacter arupensis TaxID=342002 RepID=A0A5C7Y1P2_9MYCO|nr:carboxymuconolactone decarboxylase family protein [Mycolicibacter arupensis]TXI55512.1 MAG: carboxymuconolactone decarboxylase family protein [Mycolicibacter arupensis]